MTTKLDTPIALPADAAVQGHFVSRLAYLLTVMIVHDEVLRVPPECDCECAEDHHIGPETVKAMRAYRDRVQLAICEALEDMQVVGVVVQGVKQEQASSTVVN
jgi:hypothetical protein